MKNAIGTIGAVSLLASMLTIGCLAEAGAPDEEADDQESIAESEEAISGCYRVDQSTASASYASSDASDVFGYCSLPPSWETHLSKGHPLIVKMQCGDYVWARSLWNDGQHYILRRSALSKC